MLATIRTSRCLRPTYLKLKSNPFCSSTTDANTEGKSTETTPNKTGGFAKAYEKQSRILDTQQNVENQTFETLLRNSKLMDVSSGIARSILIISDSYFVKIHREAVIFMLLYFTYFNFKKYCEFILHLGCCLPFS